MTEERQLPRLMRFAQAENMPSPDTLATYDPKWNLVVINKELYEELDWYGQYMARNAKSTLVID